MCLKIFLYPRHLYKELVIIIHLAGCFRGTGSRACKALILKIMLIHRNIHRQAWCALDCTSNVLNWTYNIWINFNDNKNFINFFLLKWIYRYFVVFRNGSQDERLDKKTRLHLLELIELRAKHWQGSDYMSQYYRHRGTHAEVTYLLKFNYS